MMIGGVRCHTLRQAQPRCKELPCIHLLVQHAGIFGRSLVPVQRLGLPAGSTLPS